MTLVAADGPLFLTIMEKTILSVTLTNPDVTSTVFSISKSTTSIAVMFLMLSLLFDLFVSLSLGLPKIATALEMFPAEITSAMIVKL